MSKRSDRDPTEVRDCKCGCGEKILRWIKRSSSTYSHENQYVLGHQSRGRKRPPHVIDALRRAQTGKAGLRGAAHPQWKGGVTPENRKHRSSAAYKKWRDSVYRRDRWQCLDCGKKCKSGDIVAHHILDFWKFTMWRFVVSNGKTLCRACHAKRHARLQVTLSVKAA